jgi:hypothetical protein
MPNAVESCRLLADTPHHGLQRRVRVTALLTCVDITVLHFSVIDKVDEEFFYSIPRRIAKGTTIPIRETYSLQF